MHVTPSERNGTRFFKRSHKLARVIRAVSNLSIMWL